MSGYTLKLAAMNVAAPRTYNAMAKLVMSLADTANNLGKKTLFGRDKGLKAYTKMLERMREAIAAMTLDGFISHSMPSTEVTATLADAVNAFAMLHPNWQDAYGFAYQLLVVERDDAVAMIERMR